MTAKNEKAPTVTVCLIRHGKAGRGDEDSSRVLTDKGKEEARWAGKRMGRLDPPVRLICSSPLARARETAELISETLGGVRVEQTSELAPGVSVDELLRLIEARKGQGVLCFVGHMPDLGELAAYLSWGERGRVMDIATGGMVLADVAGEEKMRGSVVRWVASPDDPE